VIGLKFRIFAVQILL